jgi:hypothetical protein
MGRPFALSERSGWAARCHVNSRTRVTNTASSHSARTGTPGRARAPVTNGQGVPPPDMNFPRPAEHVPRALCPATHKHLEQPRDLRLAVRHMGRLLRRVPQGRNDVPQGQQPLVDAHSLLQSARPHSSVQSSPVQCSAALHGDAGTSAARKTAPQAALSSRCAQGEGGGGALHRAAAVTLSETSAQAQTQL